MEEIDSNLATAFSLLEIVEEKMQDNQDILFNSSSNYFHVINYE